MNKKGKNRGVFITGIAFLIASLIHLLNIWGDSQWLSFRLISLSMLVPGFSLYIISGAICFKSKPRKLITYIAIALMALAVFVALDYIYSFRLIPVLALYFFVSGTFDFYRMSK